MDSVLNGLRAAAEETRLRILALCAYGELSVSDLTHILGQSQPRVSRHLKLLCDAGLLDRFREGTNAYFRLPDFGSGAGMVRLLVAMIPADDPVLALDLERLAAIKRQRAAAAAAYFAENAARWDELRSLHVDDGEVEAAIAALLPRPNLGDLLDLGTGTGRMLTVFGPQATRAVGVDTSREMLAIARANLDRAGLVHCQIRQGDIYQLPLPGASFDLAIMHQVLHYLEDPQDALDEAARVLRPGGMLLVVDFAAHAVEALRTDHAHRWLGFREHDVTAWMRRAHFDVDKTVSLPGDPITVTLWRGVRLGRAALAGATEDGRNAEPSKTGVMA